MNLDFDATDKLKVGVNLAVTRTDTRTVSDDNAFSTPMQLVALAPITPLRDEDGLLNDRPVTTYYNGLIDVEDATRKVFSNRTLANAYGDYSFMGHPHIKTPNIDRLAADRLTFRRGYVPSDLCCLSLATLLTRL